MAFRFPSLEIPKRNAWAQFTQDAEHLATGVCKFWNTLWSMGVFTQVASNIKEFACKCADASCVNRALREEAKGNI